LDCSLRAHWWEHLLRIAMTNTSTQLAQKWYHIETTIRVAATSALIGLATLISILNQAEVISSPDQQTANAIRILPLYDPDQYKAALILQRSF